MASFFDDGGGRQKKMVLPVCVNRFLFIIDLHLMSILASRGTSGLFVLMIFFMMFLSDSCAVILTILTIVFFIVNNWYIEVMPWADMVLASKTTERREHTNLHNTIVSRWRG